MKVAVIKEAAPGERRVALVPEAVAKLRAAGIEVLVESGAGDGAWIADGAYAEAGATIVPGGGLSAAADVILMVGRPDAQAISRLRSVDRRAAGGGRRDRGQP
jgi:NAD(P) transhydrogenase subunit alpha